MSRDSRTFPRYAVEAAVELVLPGGVSHHGMSRNVSRGGLCVETRDPVPTGALIQARLTLVFDQDKSSEPLEVSAKVVWCTPFGDSHQVGTQFLQLSQEQTTYLDMFLRYLETQRDDDGGDEDDPFAA